MCFFKILGLSLIKSADILSSNLRKGYYKWNKIIKEIFLVISLFQQQKFKENVNDSRTDEKHKDKTR